MKKIIIFLVILICFLPSPLRAEEAYKMAMMPRYLPEKIKNMIQPLSEYLAQKTGLNINLVTAKNNADYENRLKNGEIDIGYGNPIVYVRASDAHEVLVMADKGKDGNKYRGIIITRPDSGIESISDLRHKTIMIVEKTSGGGYLSPKVTLSENGIDVEKDCELVMASDNKHENVIMAVSFGDVDAGFVRESALHMVDKYIQPGTIKIVTTCAWLPNWALSVKRSLSEDKKKAIKDALTELKEPSPVLQAIELNGFRSADDSEYDIMRKLLNIK